MTGVWRDACELVAAGLDDGDINGQWHRWMTWIFGSQELCTMSFLPMLRVSFTASSGRCSPSRRSAGFFNDACDTKVMEVRSALPKAPNIGR